MEQTQKKKTSKPYSPAAPFSACKHACQATGQRMFTGERGEESRETLGVEPICRAPQFAPSTYYDRRAILRDPERASPRARSDAALSLKIDKAWTDNRKLYGARKVWHVLRRGGEDGAPLSADLLCKSPARCLIGHFMPEKGAMAIR